MTISFIFHIIIETSIKKIPTLLYSKCKIKKRVTYDFCKVSNCFKLQSCRTLLVSQPMTLIRRHLYLQFSFYQFIFIPTWKTARTIIWPFSYRCNLMLRSRTIDVFKYLHSWHMVRSSQTIKFVSVERTRVSTWIYLLQSQ